MVMMVGHTRKMTTTSCSKLQQSCCTQQLISLPVSPSTIAAKACTSRQTHNLHAHPPKLGLKILCSCQMCTGGSQLQARLTHPGLPHDSLLLPPYPWPATSSWLVSPPGGTAVGLLSPTAGVAPAAAVPLVSVGGGGRGSCSCSVPITMPMPLVRPSRNTKRVFKVTYSGRWMNL